MTQTLLAINGAFTLLLLLAAVQDMRSRTISNAWPAAILLLFGVALLLRGIHADYGHTIHFGIALIAGMTLFALGWVGGGDAKLYAATALWFGLHQALALLLLVTVTGMLIVIVRMIVRVGQKRVGLEIIKSDSIPYGVAIASGGIALTWLT